MFVFFVMFDVFPRNGAFVLFLLLFFQVVRGWTLQSGSRKDVCSFYELRLYDWRSLKTAKKRGYLRTGSVCRFLSLAPDPCVKIGFLLVLFRPTQIEFSRGLELVGVKFPAFIPFGGQHGILVTLRATLKPGGKNLRGRGRSAEIGAAIHPRISLHGGWTI